MSMPMRECTICMQFYRIVCQSGIRMNFLVTAVSKMFNPTLHP